MKKKDNASPAGAYFFKTYSGSCYVLTIEENGDKFLERTNEVLL